MLFTDRRGGVSTPPFDSLNLALPSDAPASEAAGVEENRARACRALTPDPLHWVPIRQVHGASVVVDGARGPVSDADAVVVTRSGLVGAVLTADCAPVAIVGHGAVAAVHAGWRGLVAGVVGAAVGAMRDLGAEPTEAVVGPCIHPCCYEFGAEDLALVEAALSPGAPVSPEAARAPSVRATTASGAVALDVPSAVRLALAEAGVPRVTEVDLCTSCSPDYFSHRRDGTTGRQGLLVTVGS